jgi:tRNA pseudouridine55 synthase
MNNGVILIDKPAGVTSAGVVARVKRILGARKVGHAGTLDPDATGLLICLVNGATRVAPFAVEGMKEYSGIIRLGVRTSSDDLAGDVLSESSDIPPFEAVSRAAATFVGTSQQVPPKVSAKKIQGRRAHDLERKGIEFELAPREVRIETLSVWSISNNQIGYRMVCTPGTYVRALARDMGELLGCGAAAESIRREGSGGLSVANACSLDEIGWQRVKDWSILVPQMQRLIVPRDVAEALQQGKPSGLRRVEGLPGLSAIVNRPAVFMYSVDPEEEGLGLLDVDVAGVVSHRATLSALRPQLPETVTEGR